MKLARSDSRNAAVSPISCGVPNRFIGTSRLIQRHQFSARGPVDCFSQLFPAKMMLPGAIVLTRTFVSNANRATLVERWFTAALVAP